MPKSQQSRPSLGAISNTRARLLVRLGYERSVSTPNLDEITSLSYTTTRRRLLALADMGAVSRDTVSHPHEWSLQTTPVDAEAEQVAPPDDLSQLVAATTTALADNLDCNEAPLPAPVNSWLTERDVNPEDSAGYATKIAVYRRLLRGLLYQLHQPEHPERLPPLSPGADWEAAFVRAEDVTGEAGFRSSPVDGLVDETPLWLDRVLLALHQPVYAAANPASTLASIYEELIPQAARRKLGQFATPDHIGEFLASWAVREADDTILDPGIGAGELAAHALREKIDKGATDPIADIIGVDIDETAIVMAAVTLKLVDGAGGGTLHQSDFLEFNPRSYTDGYEVTSVDGVITNPPYSRHQLVDGDSKPQYNGSLHAEFGRELDPATPLYGYFLAHAAQFLDEGGRLAAIVPTQFLETRFGQDLKRFLLEEYRIHGILELEETIEAFPDVKLQPAILLLERAAADTRHPTQILRLSDWPDEYTAEELLERDSSDCPPVADAATIGQHLLSPTERWTHFLEDDDLLDRAAMTTFDEIAEINRGIATGDNDYFCLTAEEVENYNIPPEYLSRIIRSAHGLRKINLTNDDWERWRDDGQSVYLLYCYEDGETLQKDEIDSPGVLDYLDIGEASDTTDGYLVSGRSPWYRVEKQTPAPILAKYMNRTGFLFIQNEADLRCLNNVHAITPTREYTSEERQALLAYLNSRIVDKHLSKYSRDYQGLQKVEISQLNDVPVIDPKELDPKIVSTLSELYDDLRKSRRDDCSDEAVLDSIHSVLEPILDWSDERRS